MSYIVFLPRLQTDQTMHWANTIFICRPPAVEKLEIPLGKGQFVQIEFPGGGAFSSPGFSMAGGNFRLEIPRRGLKMYENAGNSMVASGVKIVMEIPGNGVQIPFGNSMGGS